MYLKHLAITACSLEVHHMIGPALNLDIILTDASLVPSSGMSGMSGLFRLQQELSVACFLVHIFYIAHEWEYLNGPWFC